MNDDRHRRIETALLAKAKEIADNLIAKAATEEEKETYRRRLAEYQPIARTGPPKGSV